MVLRPRLAFALVLAAAAGCGLKGPLYLPDTATNIEVRPAPSAGEPTNQKVDEKERGDDEESTATAPSDAAEEEH